jgi:hypothetical protein
VSTTGKNFIYTNENDQKPPPVQHSNLAAQGAK